MKQGKGLQSFAKRMHWSLQTPSSNHTRDDSTHGHHQMVNNEIQLIIFFTAEDGEVLYSQQKLDRELTVAQIPYNYAVEMTNRFKGLDLIECLKNYGQSFVTVYMT